MNRVETRLALQKKSATPFNSQASAIPRSRLPKIILYRARLTRLRQCTLIKTKTSSFTSNRSSWHRTTFRHNSKLISYRTRLTRLRQCTLLKTKTSSFTSNRSSWHRTTFRHTWVPISSWPNSKLITSNNQQFVLLNQKSPITK